MAAILADIETPAFVINEARALANIRRFQAHCDAQGLKLRPHIKTHKTVHFARAQMTAGAVGVNCQKIGEAEVMVTGGMDDILITFNIIGASKLKRLRALSDRVAKLAVVADSAEVVAGLSRAFADADRRLDVLVECDTGGARCGVQSPEEAVALAKAIHTAAGLRFEGLLTYPPVGGQGAVVEFMTAAVGRLSEIGIDCPTVSSGGSPDMWRSGTGGVITEYRAGTYIYNDRSLVARGTCDWADCAGHVLATVVSVPAKGRAVIDAGSKALTSDLLGLEGHGRVIDHPDVRIRGLSEEHGVLETGENSELRIGDRLRIVPNHVCVVANMFDEAWLEGESGTLKPITIDARGRGF